MNDPAGTWYLHVLLDLHPAGSPPPSETRLVFRCSPTTTGFAGEVKQDAPGASPQRVDNIAWDAVSGTLHFRRVDGSSAQWFHVFATDGVLSGRCTGLVSAASAKPALRAFTGHVSGWKEELINAEDVPRVWEVRIEGDRMFVGRVRIDGPDGQRVGRHRAERWSPRGSGVCGLDAASGHALGRDVRDRYGGRLCSLAKLDA
jgi:hypothetical protein